MATYSFKSVGKTQTQTKDEELVSTQIPFGIKTPMQIGGPEGIFAMNYDLADQFADNLRNLLQTNWGERLGIYNFGANLQPLTTEFVSQDDFDAAAIERIKTAVGKWMPFIDLEDFSSTIDRENNVNTGIVNIVVTYNIPALDVKKKAVQVTLYVI